MGSQGQYECCPLQMSRWRATFQGTAGRVQQIFPVGGEIQLSQRIGRLPPYRVRQPLAGCET